VNKSASVGVALLAMLQLVGGCSLLVDANRAQCESDSDCSALGAGFSGSVCIQSFCQATPRWQCLDSPRAAAPTSGEFNVSFLVRDTVTQKPKVGFSVRLCRKLDVACSDSVSATALTDDQGMVALKAPAAFEGYARFEGGDAIPGMYFFNPPVARDLPTITVSLSNSATTAGLAALTGATQEPTRGLVLASAMDCTGVAAAGIKLASNAEDSSSRAFYAADGLPNGDATQTDDAGYGGIVNVSPGSITLTGTLASTGREIDRVTVLVQAGMMTITTLVPHGQ
jgi:hypothetical protein